MHIFPAILHVKPLDNTGTRFYEIFESLCLYMELTFTLFVDIAFKRVWRHYVTQLSHTGLYHNKITDRLYNESMRDFLGSSHFLIFYELFQLYQEQMKQGYY